jgi:outer membrane autotransporter protein
MGQQSWPTDATSRPGRWPDGMWGRILGVDGESEGHQRGIYGGAPTFDFSFYALQLGQDLYREERENGDRDHAGVYVAFGRGTGDVEHNLLGRTTSAGENSFDAISLGGYWTRFGTEGWYLDGVLQATWYDIDVETRSGFPDQDTSGWGFAASFEGGYPFALDEEWSLEPQAQLVYQLIDIDDFNDGAARVRYSDQDSLAGRVGLRLSRSWDAAEPGEPPRAMNIWGNVDLWHEFLGEPTTEFSSASGYIPFTASVDQSWAKFSVGGDFQINETTALYGNIGYDTTFDGDTHGIDGSIGFKFSW